MTGAMQCMARRSGYDSIAAANKALAVQGEELFEHLDKGEGVGAEAGSKEPEPSPSPEADGKILKRSPSEALHGRGTSRGNNKKAKLNPASGNLLLSYSKK